MVGDRDRSRGRPAEPAALVVLCAEPAVRDDVAAELRKRYGADYAVVVGATVDEVTAELALVPDRRVALALGGYSTSEPQGLEALAQVSSDHPQALRAAIVRWGELEVAESIFAAVTTGQLDAWVFRPQSRTAPGGTTPPSPPGTDHGAPGGTTQPPSPPATGQPDEEFHLAVTELLDEWASRHGGGVRGGAGDRGAVVAAVPASCGTCSSATTCRPASTMPTRAGRDLLAPRAGPSPELPVVVLRFRPDRPVLTNPNAMEIAAAFGLLDSLAPSRLRRRGDRGRAGRTERGGVRRVRGPAHGRARAAGHGRAGGHQLADPQLPGVPARASAAAGWRPTRTSRPGPSAHVPLVPLA